MTLFAEYRSRLGLSEIASLAQIPKGTAYRLLLALEEEGFVLQDRATGKWGIGFRALQQYEAFQQQMSLGQVAAPWMERLRDEVQETVALAVEDSGYGICIARVDPDHELRFQSSLGVRVPLHAGATRKVLLAFLPEERSSQILAAKELASITARTITDPGELRAELANIRLHGYAVSEGEHNSGVASVAVPVRDATGRVVASISVTGPAQRLTPERIRLDLPKLKEAARQVSLELGYRDGDPHRNGGRFG